MKQRIAAFALFLVSWLLAVPVSAQDQCLKLVGEFHCQDDGTITYTLQATNDYDFPTDDTEVISLTPGVTAEAVPMTTIPGSGISAWTLEGAEPGSTVQLRANAVQAGAGSIPGTDLVCSGEIEETVPLDVCEGSVPADFDISIIGPASCEAGESCRFQVRAEIDNQTPFDGVPSLRGEPGVTGARLGVMGPSDTTWSCLQRTANDPLTCVSAPLQLAPGDATEFFVDIRIPRSMRGNSTFEMCMEQAPPEVGENPILFVQFMLRTLGLDPGPVDGLMGPRTAAAIEEFEDAVDLEVDGEIDDELLDVLSSLGGQDANPDNDRDCAEVNVTKTITCGFGERVVGESCQSICSGDANWNGDRCVTCGRNEFWDSDRLTCVREAPNCNERTTVLQGNRCVCRYFGMERVNARRCRCPADSDLVPGIGCVAEEVELNCHERTTVQRGDRCRCRYDNMERVNDRRCRCRDGFEFVPGEGCVRERAELNCHERTTEQRGNRCRCRYDNMERVNDRRCRCRYGTDLVPGQGCVAQQAAPNCHERTTVRRGDRCRCRYDGMERVNDERCRCPNGTDLVPGQGCVAPQPAAPDCHERTTVLQGNQCVCRYDGMERVNDRRCRCPGGTDLVPGQGCVAPQPPAQLNCIPPAFVVGNECGCQTGFRYDENEGCVETRRHRERQREQQNGGEAGRG